MRHGFVLPNTPFVAVGEGALLDPDLIEAAGSNHADPSRSAAMAVARLGQIRFKKLGSQ